MTGTRIVLGTAVLAMTTAMAAEAQSLGDVARQEEERRKTVAAPGRVYTNDSLRVVTPAAAPLPLLPIAMLAPGADAGAAADADDDEAASETREAPAARDEPYWRQRIQEERDVLRRSRTFADALQSRINALTADFTARDDPAQRDLIAQDRQRALDELDRLTEEINAQTRAIAATEEEARRAGVPPAWLR